MELRHLRYFAAVAEDLHFGRAAQRLMIAQPSLSQQIHSLEGELGVQLFRRSRRSVALTPAGRAFLAEVRRTLEQADRAVETLHRAARGELGSLSVGFTSAATFEPLPGIVCAYRRRYPDVDLTLHELTTSDQVSKLVTGELDVAFLAQRHLGEGFESVCTARLPLVAALPAGHRLAARRRLRLGELAGEQFIFTSRERGSAYYDHILAICQRAGFAPNVAQQATQVSTQVALVSAGIGVALVPVSMKKLYVDGVLYREIDVDAAVDINMEWSRQNEAPALLAFVAVVYAYASASKDRAGETDVSCKLAPA